MSPKGRLEERPFHRWLSHHLRGRSRGLLPVGDDAAALPVGGRRVALLTTDALVEWTHFLPGSPPRSIGGAAAGASLSDLAAKGGHPVALTLDLLLPAETSERWAREVVRGADERMREFGGALVGGDTKSSETPAVIGTVLGWGRSDRLAPRSGAKVGDLVAVTGTVGRGGQAYQNFTAKGPQDLGALRQLLRIDPRVREGRRLVEFAHALLDTSDGVADGAHLLGEASGVRIELDAERIPLARGLERDPDGGLPSTAFFGGDYELLAAVPPARIESARRSIERIGGRLTTIGRVARGRGAILRYRGLETPLPSAGYRTFG
jgi:thiamine-monophosphate kinase